MERETLFVEVLLPLHVRGTFTYRVPYEYNESIQVGQRVAVQFGRKKIYAALVRSIHQQVPQYATKYIMSILDLRPIVTEQQFVFWDWIADYYMCYPGDVMAIAFPSAFKLASESCLSINPQWDGEYSALTANELRVIDALSNKTTLRVDEISNIVGFQKVMPLLNTMIDKGIIVMDEELKQRYAPKHITHLVLNPRYADEAAQRQLFDTLEQKTQNHKQLSVLMKFMQLSHFGKEKVRKKALTDCHELSASAIDTLIKKEILLQESLVESRLETYTTQADVDTIVLNEQQQQAFDQLMDPQRPSVQLLHGVTSSGKTEVYIKLIEQTLRHGKQVLFLLPEIALTAQLINRLRKYFGSMVGVYHSRFNPNERAEVWYRTQDPTPHGFQIILGARSALFLPFHSLGLVIVDEEHDSSYKQYDPSPRYQGRDCAIYLAHLWHAHVVLGSATPSLESFYNAQRGKYGYTTITQRYGGNPLPEMVCVDMKQAQLHGEVKAKYFSFFLLEQIRQALARQEQVILFQNRRGFSLRLVCSDCNWTPQCEHCDVSLVYHKSTHSLRCHYCGYSIPLPSECPVCHSTHLKTIGFGTEHIEEDLEILFPNAHIARLDIDSVQQKNKYVSLLNDFEDRQIDILVGTQMVTKGLDFEHVSVVGIMSADNLISFPDFRSHERAFQQIVQVAGRAGRHKNRGTVVIQSYDPNHPIIHDAVAGNYLSMYQHQIQERRIFNYPPFYKLIEITMRHRDEQVLNAAADLMAQWLRGLFDTNVMGPEYPNVIRVRNYYQKRIIVRFDKSAPLSHAKQQILLYADNIIKQPGYQSILFTFDVDP